jgi:tetratricopeptide (TPR) repeat protein
MLIVLDNAESILDPQGVNGREIYAVVEELSRLSNICLVITSRIAVIPPNCETLEVPTLSTGAAHDMFYHIYKYGGRSNSINDLLKQLDFHPLSVTLLATVAHRNKWDSDRLAKEWEQRRIGVLRTEHQTSLATTIELSLSSLMFKELGSDARGLLGVIAFYPQGINEDNLDWLFPTIPDVTRLLDKFCILSLTYRSNGFTTMLAPLRDYLRPKDPTLSPLLCTTKERYFARMSVKHGPNQAGFKDVRWIVSEDVNVEHLLDTLLSIDPDSNDHWDACTNFVWHLKWHKPRQTVLKPKVEALPDSHRSKPECLFEVAVLSGSAGNHTEKTRLLHHVLRLERERRNDHRVALTLDSLCTSSRMLGLRKEGILQAKEASEIYERLGRTVERARCLEQLARLLSRDGQLDAAEEAAVQSNKLLPKKGKEYEVCQSHRTLGDIYRSKGQREKAMHHYKVALGIASSSNWHTHLFWTHFSLVELCLAENNFEDAYSHVKQVKLHAPENQYHLGRAALLQAKISYRQHSLDDATSEVSRALGIFGKVGASKELEDCKTLIRNIEQAAKSGPRPAGKFPVVSFWKGCCVLPSLTLPFQHTIQP